MRLATGARPGFRAAQHGGFGAIAGQFCYTGSVAPTRFTSGAVALITLVTGSFACYRPAQRRGAADPMESLRAEYGTLKLTEDRP